MLIYPDSSDLINLCRGRACIGISELAETLHAESHQLVLSLETLIELVAPLRNGYELEVRRDLNRLDQLPLTFVNEARIYYMELREAVRAFEQSSEYEFASVAPFASCLADAADEPGYPQYIIECGMRVPTKMLVNFRLADAIRYLWKYDPKILEVYRRREKEWISVMNSDRAMANPPALPDHFVTAMIQHLAAHGIRPPAVGAEPFARWVYESPLRCPGVRLAYETQHRFRRDRQALPSASDLTDLSRVNAVPYVDFFITDAAMMTYCRQAVAEIGVSGRQLVGDFRAVMSHLDIG